MIPAYLDFIMKVGRWLGTARSLIIQTEELFAIIDNYTSVEDVLVDGLDL